MIKDISYFLFHPKVNGSLRSISFESSILLTIKIILLYTGFIIFSSILFFPFLYYVNLFPEQRISLSAIPLSFKLIVFVPICEETIFRLPLKFSKDNLFLSLSAFQFMLFYHTFNLVILVCISFMIASMPYLKIIPDKFYSKLKLIWQKYFPFIFYGLTLSFGLLHLTNFVNLKLGHYLLSPLIVSNQIFMGLMFGYVRVSYNNGFIISVILHFLINLPLILITHL